MARAVGVETDFRRPAGAGAFVDVVRQFAELLDIQSSAPCQNMKTEFGRLLIFETMLGFGERSHKTPRFTLIESPSLPSFCHVPFSSAHRSWRFQ